MDPKREVEALKVQAAAGVIELGGLTVGARTKFHWQRLADGPLNWTLT